MPQTNTTSAATSHAAARAAQAGLSPTWLSFRYEVIVWEYERGLLYRDGRFERLLSPGRYPFWRWEKVRVAKVSTRQISEVITGQEIMSSDKIELRISLIAQYVVSDPVVAVNMVESYTDQLYQELQLSLREAVASRTVEQVLEARDEIGMWIQERVAPSALNYGVTLRRIGIRDVVLPGVVRTVFLKEVEADRTGRADLIRARHEVAAARARANTARILAENPNVARMQELDALVNLAGKQGNVVLLPSLADLLVPRNASTFAPPTEGGEQE